MKREEIVALINASRERQTQRPMAPRAAEVLSTKQLKKLLAKATQREEAMS